MPIDYEKRDGVAYITLNNPAKANILDKETSDAISAGMDRPLGGSRYPLRDRDRRRRPAFLRRPQSGAAREHHRRGARISAHPADLLAARRHRARAEDRGRRPHGRPLPARVEAGHRRGQWLGGRRRALSAAGLDRYPHRQPRARPVQVRADDPGLARPRPRRDAPVEAAPLYRRDEDAADRRPGRCRGGVAHRPDQRSRAARRIDGSGPKRLPATS